jgi:hypothetical protein
MWTLHLRLGHPRDDEKGSHDLTMAAWSATALITKRTPATPAENVTEVKKGSCRDREAGAAERVWQIFGVQAQS